MVVMVVVKVKMVMVIVMVMIIVMVMVTMMVNHPGGGDPVRPGPGVRRGQGRLRETGRPWAEVWKLHHGLGKNSALNSTTPHYTLVLHLTPRM